MKVIYVSFLNEDTRPGYRTKIHSQAKAFNDLGCKSYLYTINNENIIMYSFNEGTMIVEKQIAIQHNRKNKNRNVYDEFFILREFMASLLKEVDCIKPDMVYFRRIVPITPILLNTIKQLKKRGIYVAYEYPTYPWEKEMIVTGKKIFYYIDKFFYNSLFSLIDLLVCFGEFGENNKKVVETMNGVDVDEYRLHKKRVNNQAVSLLAIGHIMPQHGYDKLIRGLQKYYEEKPDTDIFIHIVGEEGPNVHLKSLAYKCHIQDHIKFWGFKTGEELDDIFDQADIGVDCLALNRIETNNLVGSLKSREFLARGLPFIFAGNLDFVRKESKKLEFVYEVDENLDYVDFNTVLTFYKNCHATPEEIRNYAEENLSWEKMMKKVLDKYEYDKN